MMTKAKGRRLSISGQSLPFLVIILLLHRVEIVAASTSNVIDDGFSASSLTPNQFYKICPRTINSGRPFGSPTCGDGTNFCFYFSRPSQRKENKERVLIELMGGGACWDGDTCSKMASYLTFPQDLDNFAGLSCSEIHTGLQNDGGNKKINMLCAQSIGATDFTSYNTVIIPYCTQDVHIGSNIMQYSSDNGRRLDQEEGYDSTVRHMGAHNIMSTLRWVFKNFPNAQHFALTGCSAGGTGLPIVYDLVRKHYNHFGIRKVQINTISDSPVYLTPSYFLENALDNWNPFPMLDRVGFNYNKYRYSEEYPTAAWDYILRKGANKDRWGFVSHVSDPISLTYYEYMSGSGDNGNRRLDQDMESEWYSELTSSLDTIQAKHKNVETYWINDEGHCSFGLYYALQEDGFEAWSGSVFQESTVSMAPRPAVGAFVVAILMGVGLSVAVLFSTRKKSRSTAIESTDSLMSDPSVVEMPRMIREYVRENSVAFETAESMLSDQNIEEIHKKCFGRLKASFSLRMRAWLSKVSDCPITAGLAFTITVFFWTMICTEGFAHPLNNPSLGPSAIGLSRYGINNPSLIVYKRQWFRIITSNFLCSGVLTYLLTMTYLAYPVRSLEMTLASPRQTLWIISLVAIGINLMYAWILEGATCSALAFVLGLQAVHLVLKRQRGLPNHYTIPVICMLLVFFLSFLFPFNNQWMMLSSILMFGPAAGWFGLKVSLQTKATENQVSDEYVGEPMDDSSENDTKHGQTTETVHRDGLINDEQATAKYTPRKEIMYGYAVWLVLVVLGLGFNGPNELYMEAFYTGCELYYSTDVENIASDLYSNDEDRRLDENSYESMCAEFCIPHIASRFVKIGVDKLGVPIQRGQCQDVGYDERVADKTFAYMSYSLDVEVYYSSQ